MYGELISNKSITWVPASRDVYICLSNAVLLNRPKKKDARVVLELVERPSEERLHSDGRDDADRLRIAIAVLSSEKETVRLNVTLNSELGLRLSGSGTDGAVVQVTGSEFEPELDDSDDDPDFELDTPLVDFDELLDDDNEDEEESPITATKKAREALERAKAPNGLHRASKEGEPSSSKAGDKPLASKPSDSKSPEKSIAKKNKAFVSHKSGVRWQDLLQGTGKKVVRGHNVAMCYTLRLENGKVVDKADKKRPFKFRVGIGECIKGFDIGVSGMREGGERHLVVPPELGYGDQRTPGIPPGSTLYFDVKVVKAY